MNNQANNTAPAPTYHAVVNGHLHTAHCGHRNPTQWASGHRGNSINTHMVELDGLTVAQVIEAHGAACCSHCMPTAPSGAKMTQAQIDDMNGTTARRAAIAARAAARDAALATPALVALTARFVAARDAGDDATAGPLYHQMIAMQRELGAE